MFIVLPSVALGFAEVHNMGIGIPDSLGTLEIPVIMSDSFPTWAIGLASLRGITVYPPSNRTKGLVYKCRE